jgi:hypothetical protein
MTQAYFSSVYLFMARNANCFPVRFFKSIFRKFRERLNVMGMEIHLRSFSATIRASVKISLKNLYSPFFKQWRKSCPFLEHGFSVFKSIAFSSSPSTRHRAESIFSTRKMEKRFFAEKAKSFCLWTSFSPTFFRAPLRRFSHIIKGQIFFMADKAYFFNLRKFHRISISYYCIYNKIAAKRMAQEVLI